MAGEAAEESSRGSHTSENVDMSSERSVRNISAERPRVPGPGSSSQGEPDPKSRPKGVDDGKRVNIPVLLLRAMEGRSRVGQPHVG